MEEISVIYMVSTQNIVWLNLFIEVHIICDVIWALWRLKSPKTVLFQQLVQNDIKENINCPFISIVNFAVSGTAMDY